MAPPSKCRSRSAVMEDEAMIARVTQAWLGA